VERAAAWVIVDVRRVAMVTSMTPFEISFKMLSVAMASSPKTDKPSG